MDAHSLLVAMLRMQPVLDTTHLKMVQLLIKDLNSCANQAKLPLEHGPQQHVQKHQNSLEHQEKCNLLKLIVPTQLEALK
jgi:hypothetical protein